MEPRTTAARGSDPAGLSAADPASLVGSTLGDRYRLLEVIGDGGMGRVYRAERLATRQMVALKLLQPEFAGVDQIVQRFQREAHLTFQLSHPHIVKVVEFGEWNGRLFLAMELLAGKSLAELIQRDAAGRGRRLTVERTIAIMRAVLDALEYAHRRDVVHRDLKPENIMVIPARGLFSREGVKLLDFGIAKLGDERDGTRQKLTQMGLLLGTPGYMSPEQAVGQQADVRSDLYSCGVILYEMLTGQRPFESDSNLEILAMHLNTAPRSLRAVAPDAHIPAAVEAVVLRALAKRPAERFQTARALRQALERAPLVPDTGAAVSGLDATMLATPTAPRAPSRWMGLAIAAVVTAMLIGEHMRPRTPGSGRRVASGDPGEPAHRAHAAASAEGPAASHNKHNTNQSRATSNQSRATSKRPPVKSHQ
jgi:serine/threonine-protein kinase